MSVVRVYAVFWRRIWEASHKALHAQYSGQYHITVPGTIGEELDGFLEGLTRYDPTNNGGFTIDIPIQRFDGTPSVEPQSIKVRYMGQMSARKDWNFPAQSTGAYPMWGPGRGVSNVYDPSMQEYIMLVKEEGGSFHARWQHGTDDLPTPLQQRMQASEFGVWRQDSK